MDPRKTAAEAFRGVGVRDENGFDLTDCPEIGLTEVTLLHRAGLNSVLSLVNASSKTLASVLGVDELRARKIIAWASEQAYPAASIADSEVVASYRDGGVAVPASADPIGAAKTTASTVDFHNSLPPDPSAPDAEKTLPADDRQSTDLPVVRVLNGKVVGAEDDSLLGSNGVSAEAKAS